MAVWSCKFFPPRNEFAVIAENNHAVAIICDTAKSWGHSLIIPQQHSSNLASPGMNETIWKEGLVPLLREVIEKFTKNPQVIGFHINSNAGVLADQSVYHTHIHVVPKYENGEGFSCDNEGKWKQSKGYNFFEEKWENLYQPIKEHIDKCLEDGTLKKGNDGVIEHFNLFSRVGKVDGGNYSQEHFHFIPKPSDYEWMRGNTKCYNFSERKKIVERIKNEEWEEKNPNSDPRDNYFWINMNVFPSWVPNDFHDNYYLFSKIGSKNFNESIIINKNHKELNKWSGLLKIGLNSKYSIKFQEKKQIYEVNDWLEVTDENGRIPHNKNGNNDNQNQPPKHKENNNSPKPNNDKENNEEPSKDQEPNNAGSNNNPTKDKNNSNAGIPNSVKKYFQENKVKEIELDGENWIITFKDKKTKKTIPVADDPKLQDLKDYLQSRGKKSLADLEVKNDFNTSSPTNNSNEDSYWPWILGIGGILAVILIGWLVVVRNKKKKRIMNK